MKSVDDEDRLSTYDYLLPPELIAQEPVASRGESRLMVVSRGRAEGWRHERFAALPRLLRAGDLLVFNDVRVRRARLRGRLPSGTVVELLLLREVAGGAWECLGRPGRRLRAGVLVHLPGDRAARIVEQGSGLVVVSFDGVGDLDEYLARHGEIPLPPYIKRPNGPCVDDDARYQTVYARRIGAVAAPTAGLHFTHALIDELRATGVELAWVTLDVGPATFLPVRAENLAECRLDAERASIPERTADLLAATKGRGGRVIAVGTTTTRALESRAAAGEGVRAGEFGADAFLRRAGDFRVVDGMVTNFHLPQSTLLVLVCAFAGRRPMLAAYAEAVRQRYRFYSYGDAMLIL